MPKVRKCARLVAVAGVMSMGLFAGAASPPVASADHCQPEQLVGLDPVIHHDDSPVCFVADRYVYPTTRTVNNICLYEHPLLRSCDLYVYQVVKLPEGKPYPH